MLLSASYSMISCSMLLVDSLTIQWMFIDPLICDILMTTWSTKYCNWNGIDSFTLYITLCVYIKNISLYNTIYLLNCWLVLEYLFIYHLVIVNIYLCSMCLRDAIFLNPTFGISCREVDLLSVISSSLVAQVCTNVVLILFLYITIV